MFTNSVSRYIDCIQVFEKRVYKYMYTYIYITRKVIFYNGMSEITICSSLNSSFVRGYHGRIWS